MSWRPRSPTRWSCSWSMPRPRSGRSPWQRPSCATAGRRWCCRCWFTAVHERPLRCWVAGEPRCPSALGAAGRGVAGPGGCAGCALWADSAGGGEQVGAAAWARRWRPRRSARLWARPRGVRRRDGGDQRLRVGAGLAAGPGRGRGLAGLARLALFAVVTAGGSSLLNMVVKSAVHRVRPVLAHPLAQEVGWSFPSAHAQGAMVGYAVLLLVALPILHGPWRTAALAFAAFMVLAIGFSRVALGVHYVSDVVGGLVLGAAWVAVMAAAHAARRTR